MKMVWVALEQLIAQSTYPYSIRVDDLDNDNDNDILALHFDGFNGNKLVWYENLDGLGTFSDEIFIEEDDFTSSMQIEDIDGDGDQDILIPSWNLSPGKINLYRNDGMGNFGTQEVLFQFSFADSDSYKVGFLSLSDLNGDDKKDILFTAHHDDLSNYIMWLEAIDGSGTFGPPTTIHSFNYSPSISTMQNNDLDNDGDQDLLLGFASANNYGNLSYIINSDGLGNFENLNIAYEDIERTSHVTAADIDNDGDLDAIVCSSFGNRLAWYENNGLLTTEENKTNIFAVFPNPATSVLHIKTEEPISNVTLYNILGMKIMTVENTTQLEISEISSGIYSVEINTVSGRIDVQKIIKK